MADERKVTDVTVDELVSAIAAKLNEPKPVPQVIHTPFGAQDPNAKIGQPVPSPVTAQREWRTAAELVSMMPDARARYTDLDGQAVVKIRNREIAENLAEDCMQRFYPRY